MYKLLVAIILMSFTLGGCQIPKTGSTTHVERYKKKSYKRGKGVQRRVVLEARKQGVPKSLALAIAKQESGFRCNIRGRAGEIGPLQIKPSSARMLGYRGSTRNLRRNCSAQIRWGMKHLALSYRKGGRKKWKAAYRHNAGPYAKSYRNRQARKYANSVMRLTRRY